MRKTPFILFFILLNLLSCATINAKKGNEIIDISIYNSEKTYIEETFLPYVESFIKDSMGSVTWKKLKGLVVIFEDIKEEGVIGQCSLFFEKKVTIDREWWDKNTNDAQRMQLIYHELGHCVLLRNHTEPANADYSFFEKVLFFLGIFKRQYSLIDGCEPSLMHPTMTSLNCTLIHKEYYINELFRRTNYRDKNKQMKDKK